MLQVQLLSGPPFTDLKTKKILNMSKEQKRHEKHEKHSYKKGAKKVMPCDYKKKGKK
jgi:hypothetical protein